MPQVSKRPLSKDIEIQLFSIFFKSFARLSQASDIERFLLDLLGPVERTMLAKRLAIALLLMKGYRYNSIKEILKVSQETIARVNISLQYHGEGYSMIVTKMLKDEQIESILRKIEDTTISILPTSSLKRSLVKDQKSKKYKTPLGY